MSSRTNAGNRMSENMEALTSKGKRQSQQTAPSRLNKGQKRPTEDTQHSHGPATPLERLAQERQRKGLPTTLACVPETEQQQGGWGQELEDYND